MQTSGTAGERRQEPHLPGRTQAASYFGGTPQVLLTKCANEAPYRWPSRSPSNQTGRGDLTVAPRKPIVWLRVSKTLQLAPYALLPWPAPRRRFPAQEIQFRREARERIRLRKISHWVFLWQGLLVLIGRRG
jgi:hypothetical protein